MQMNSFISNFNRIIKSMIFVCGLVIIIFLIGEWFESVAAKNQFASYAKRRFEEFYEQDRDSIDMVFIGSSHSYCTFDPEIFDEELGTSSFQLGTPLQHPDTSYYVLKEVLEYQKPKIVVFEIYWDMLDEPFNLKQADLFMESVRPSELIDEYISDVFPINEKVKYYIKTIRYQPDMLSYFDKQLKDWVNKYRVQTENENKEELPLGTEYYKSKGYVYADIIIPKSEKEEDNQFNDFDARDWLFDKTQRNYVKKLIQLAKQNNIEVVLVTAPVANVSMEKISNYEFIHDKINEFAQEQNVAYIDYNIVNIEEQLLVNENFRDDAHLNHSGVEIVDRHFINWLGEKGIFE
ncbi:MAG: DUF1574 family protein [Eubacteriales bacterium]